jgi:hypothetical protein
MQRESLWVSGSKAVASALAATLVVRWLAVAVLTIPPDFQPLAGPGPVIFFTTIGALGAVGVYAIVRRVTQEPDVVFRWIALVVLVLSIMPDMWLLTDAAAETFPGATTTAVTVLMTLHIVAAAVIVWFLTSARGAPAPAGD